MTNYIRQYKLFKTRLEGLEGATTINENGSISSFLFDPNNTDYQAYLAWVAEGNTPLPADE